MEGAGCCGEGRSAVGLVILRCSRSVTDRQRQRETWTAGQASLQFQKDSTLGMSKGSFRAGPGHSVGIRFRRGNLKRLIPNGPEVRKARVGG